MFISFSQCKVSLCERNTHDINSLFALVKTVVASKHKRQTTTLCQDLLLTIEDTVSDLKLHALHYANELLVRARRAFQKLLQPQRTSTNNKKLSKKGFWL